MNLASGTFTTLRLKDIPVKTGGATGLCAFDGDVMCVLQGRPNSICRIDRHLAIKQIWPSELVSRGHSICSPDDKTLFVVSTARDAVIRMEPNSQGSDWWSFAADNQYSIHLNSICAVGQSTVLATAFGHPGGAFNTQSAEDGFICNLGSNEFLIQGLSHPHSLCSIGQRLLFCESAKGIIRDDAGNTLYVGGGYIRGLAATQSQLFVGVSGRRSISMSNSSAQSPINGELGSGAQIVAFSWRNGELSSAREARRIDLSAFAAEIYDLLII